VDALQYLEHFFNLRNCINGNNLGSKKVLMHLEHTGVIVKYPPRSNRSSIGYTKNCEFACHLAEPDASQNFVENINVSWI